MKSKEAFSYASMLVASHDNAMDGSLFVGDCSWATAASWTHFLTSPCLSCQRTKPGSALGRVVVPVGGLDICGQAAQKGWDGVWCPFLVALVGVQWVVHSTPRGPLLVQGWPDCGGVDGEEFGGRFAVLGAIQGFTGSNVHHETLAFSTRL